jgi:hypothetical protein
VFLNSQIHLCLFHLQEYFLARSSGASFMGSSVKSDHDILQRWPLGRIQIQLLQIPFRNRQGINTYMFDTNYGRDAASYLFWNEVGYK